MTPELQKYYEDRLGMMGSKAWKDLIEDVQAMYDASNKLDGVTPENFQFKQGELSIMRWILSLKDASEQAYKDLQDYEDLLNG